jgi:uncharacterized protein (DUF983 family)
MGGLHRNEHDGYGKSSSLCKFWSWLYSDGNNDDLAAVVVILVVADLKTRGDP